MAEISDSQDPKPLEIPTEDLAWTTELEKSAETESDSESGSEVDFDFDLQPINKNEDYRFGHLPDNLELGDYQDYVQDLNQLNLNSSVTDQSYSKNLFQKEKPKSNLPQPIDFNKTSIEDLAKSKTKLLKEKKYKNKHEKPLENWYDMKRPELTEELETDLKALHNRGAMDSKSFYRKNDRAGHIPKHFEVARIINSPLESKHNLTKKQRKSTFVEELLHDESLMRYQKKRVLAQHAKNISNRTYGKRKFDVKKHKRNLKRRREKLEGNKKSTGD